MSQRPAQPSTYLNRPWYVILFICILSAFSGILLSTVYYFLAPIQERAALFDKNQQMLAAAQILNEKNEFQLNNQGVWVPAVYNPKTRMLEKSQHAAKTSFSAFEQYMQQFVHPLFTDSQGNIVSDEAVTKNLNNKTAYFPFYAILKNDPAFASFSASEVAKSPSSIHAIVIPISGFGLWGPLHGFLAIANDGHTVLGASWYQQVETPGLGANITTPQWLKQFYGKQVFSVSPSGSINFDTATLGLKVLKGSVANLGDSPEALSSIDGISGATLTGNGVTNAYTHSLKPYRHLLMFFAKQTQTKEKYGK